MGEKRRRAKGRASGSALSWKDYHYIAGGRGARIAHVIYSLILPFAALYVATRPGIDGDEAFAAIGFILMFGAGGACILVWSYHASRIFRIERSERALSSLFTLPIPTSSIIGKKVIGCLAPSQPLIIMAVIGGGITALWLFHMVVTERPRFEDMFYGILFTMHGIFSTALLPVFVAWLSLRVRWGAFLVGGTIWAVGGWFVLLVCVLTFEEGSSVILPALSGFALAYFARAIPRRLHELAAEE
jgi:hypothetical protein